MNAHKPVAIDWHTKTIDVNTILDRMIAEGEHQQQDFKYAINDSRKIAKSLVAFANTDGGRLLIGVKDNGVVAGVADEEEYYMIEAAAQLYCRPVIEFVTLRHETKKNKVVLEIQIPKSDSLPHYAEDKDGKWWAYQRVADENILADKIQLEVWRCAKKVHGTHIEYSDGEKLMLDALNTYDKRTLNQLVRYSKRPYKKAKEILVKLILTKVVGMQITNHGVFYHLQGKTPAVS